MKTIPPYTKVYLRDCRRGQNDGCIKKFFSTQPNKMYCSAKCLRESVLVSNRKARREYKKKYPEIENSRRVGNVQIGAHRNPNFKKEQSIIKKEKRHTFLTHTYDKRKHKSTLSGAEFPLNHHNYNDLPAFSISYLKDNQVKCPECENKQNLIEHALNICSRCGLILKAPSIHVGYEVDDLLPKKKICPTVQDLNRTKNLKSAHELAFVKYNEQITLIDCEVQKNDILNFNDSDPLNPIFWGYYRKKKIYNK